MKLGKVKHFLRGWFWGFVASLAIAVIGYILVVLVISFLLWTPVTVIGAISGLTMRVILTVCVLAAIWFADTKEWRSTYQGD